MGAGTWLITEAEKQEDGDWKLFGFCHICEWEWGYLMLSDLQRIVLPGGLGIERDLYTQGRIVRLYRIGIISCSIQLDNL